MAVAVKPPNGSYVYVNFFQLGIKESEERRDADYPLIDAVVGFARSLPRQPPAPGQEAGLVRLLGRPHVWVVVPFANASDAQPTFAQAVFVPSEATLQTISRNLRHSVLLTLLILSPGLFPPAGDRLREFGRHLLDDWQTLRHELRHVGEPLQGRLRVYCSVTASYFLLPDILGRFRARYPQLEIKLETGDPALAVDKVLSDEAELGRNTSSLQVGESLGSSLFTGLAGAWFAHFHLTAELPFTFGGLMVMMVIVGLVAVLMAYRIGPVPNGVAED